MRIPSGKTDQAIYFVAVDATDYVTRETGLSGFTVYRSRNGAAEVAYTTPTVTEIDTTNMPGVYALLIDEDTTIASTSDSEEMALHITCTGMAPVTRTIELYRRDTTSGRTLDVSAGGEAGIDWANIGSPTTAVNLSGTNIDTDQVVASVSGAVGSVTGAVGSVTGSVGSVTGLTASNLDATISSRASAADLATAITYIDTEIAAILADTNELQADWADGGRLDNILDARASQTSVDDIPTTSELTTALSGLATAADLATVDNNVVTVLTTTNKLDDTLEDDAGTYRFTTNALEQAPTGGSAPSAADIRAEIDSNSTQLAAIKAKTDGLTFTVAGQVDSNIQYVNDSEVTGSGTGGDPWGP